MKVITISHSSPRNIDALQKIELPQPSAIGHNLKTISVNFVDTKGRAGFETRDIIALHQLLACVGTLIYKQIITTTLSEHYGTITAANLQKAHAPLETRRAVDKIVLEGF